MMPPSARATHQEDAARDTLTLAAEVLADRAEALLARTPLHDPRLPETGDLDLLAVGEAEDFLPERLSLEALSPVARRVDLIWVPRERLSDPGDLARLGLVGHRLLGSEVIYDRTGLATRQRSALAATFYDPKLQTARIEGFLDMGFYTVREIGVTWDFPALALFWVHMAHAACLAAILDGARTLCPNVYTRPFDHLRRAEEAIGHPLEQRFFGALRLDLDPRPLEARLRRMHETVSRRFPEPDWPEAMRRLTRYEYRYFGSRAELEWRLGVAAEMSRRGERPAAVFHLRFWAYALARLPMVHQRALEGRDVSFVRPSRAVRPELERLCPEILEDLSSILGLDDRGAVRQADVEDSLGLLEDLRRETLDYLRARGLDLAHARAWRPYEAPSRAADAHPRLQSVSR